MYTQTYTHVQMPFYIFCGLCGTPHMGTADALSLSSGTADSIGNDSNVA
jgi:hypothetical protein